MEDLEGVLQTPHILDRLAYEKFGQQVSSILDRQLRQESDGRTLRMSNLGMPCKRKLQYTVNGVEGENLPASARFKFMYGHIIEALVLLLAREAGHEVVGEQDTVEIEGVFGHRDAIIDGTLVDVKSAATLSFKKFKDGLKPSEDPFGYLTQLSAYHFASLDDPLLVDRERAAFLVVDKQLGHICLDLHRIDRGVDWRSAVRDAKELVSSNDLAPRGFFDEPEGKSGNRKLSTNCSYCEFKHTCWPNLRTFLYSKGPVYMTNVVREPDVPELGVNNVH